MSAAAIGRPATARAAVRSPAARVVLRCSDGALCALVAGVLARDGFAPAGAGEDADAIVALAEFHLLDPPTALAELCSEADGVPVVVVARGRDVNAVRKALHAGAAGLVREARIEESLGATVRAVLAGQLAVPREREEQREAPALSAREREVLALVGRGLSNGEIARRLFLAESTVKTHLSAGFRKLGVRSRAEAAAVIAAPAVRRALGLPDELAA